MREKTYRIGEAADLLHLKSYVLRFWETEFPQLAPLRTDKGQRLYTDSHIALLRRIRQLLHEQGMTIEGARRVLASASVPEQPLPLYAPLGHAPTVQAPCGASMDDAITGANPKGIDPQVLREMRQELMALRHLLSADDE